LLVLKLTSKYGEDFFSGSPCQSYWKFVAHPSRKLTSLSLPAASSALSTAFAASASSSK
jgi:hypothetical protein